MEQAKRKCEECQECCTKVSVKALDKPSDTICKHQCQSGCAIYATRPKECAQFHCSWLNGNLPDDMRPDKSGVIVEEMYWDRFTMHYAYESRPGSMDKQLNRLQEEFVKPGHIFLKDFERLDCHPDDKKEVEQLAWMIANGKIEMRDCDGVQIV